MSIISAPRLLVDGQLSGPGAVVIDDGRISDVLDRPPAAGPDHLALPSGLLTAGMVDVQLNGSFGVDLAAGDPDGWALVAGSLPARGVTAFQPTYITAPVSRMRDGLDRAARLREKLAGRGCARILGVHLEGPFLSPVQHGVHEPGLMALPSRERLDVLLVGEDRSRIPGMVTLAPEREGGLEAIRRLRDAGVVVSVGHTNATAEQTLAAADAGASMVTHIFNAQRGLGHREPGVVGAALDDERFSIGLIADLMHVAPTACRLVLAVAAGRVVLVSDAMAAAGMPPGRYELGGQTVVVTAEGLPRNLDGTIAGSALCLDVAVRNLVGIGCDPARVLDAATRAPAAVLDRPDLGRLAEGAHADLVWWSDDLHVRRTWIAGEPTYAADLA